MPDLFQNALELVHQSLRDMRDRGSDVRASTGALIELTKAASAPTAAPVTAHGLVATAAFAETPATVEVPNAKAEVPPPTTIAAPVPRSNTDGKSRADLLAELRGPVLACTLCPHLVKARTQVVFGVGNPDAELMFVGEAPGEDEDLQGEPFVGKAGQLLTRIIETMGFSRDQVYIANVLKCRPDMPPGASGNRKPTATEMSTCLPYLERQISIIQPRVLVALGATAMEGLLGETAPMARLRGRWHDFRGTPLMATYHPAYLLRNQSLGEKRKVWEDMLLVLERLGIEITEKQRSYFLTKS